MTANASIVDTLVDPARAAGVDADEPAGAGDLTGTPVEADWDRAPNLLEGAQELTLTAEQCDLAYWLSAVAQGTLRGRARRGHATVTPEYMRQPGPLREALIL